MNLPYHIQVTTEALGDLFSPTALKIIIQANRGQDSLWNLVFGPKEFHFDDCKFESAYAWLETEKNEIFTALSENNAEAALKALGRMTHAWQDFYSHSNYLSLWAASVGGETLPPPQTTPPLHPDFIAHPDLVSGMVYLLEGLALIPSLAPLARRLLPPDAHANMNLDEPSRGPLFPHSLVAARKRTRHEVVQLLEAMDASQRNAFTMLPTQ